MLSAYIDSFLLWKSSYTTHAYKNYRPVLVQLNQYINKKIEDITEADIMLFQNRLKVKYHPGGVAFRVTVIKNFFDYFSKKHICKIDPYFIKIPKYTPRPHDFVTYEEFKKMDTVAGEGNFWELQRRVAIRLMYECGLRVGELVAINTLDILLPERKAFIIAEKSLKRSLIKWSEETHQLLVKYIGTRICLNSYPALFIGSNGPKRDRITSRSVERWVVEIARQAGINYKHVVCHSLRHGKAHRVKELGGDIVDIQKNLRHTNLISSQRYTHFDEVEQEKIVDKFLAT